MNATALSCFSGVGGLDLGLEAAGFDTVGCLEIDEHARAALAANRPKWTLVDPGDVVEAGRSLRPSDLGLAPRELTLIAGGPPCQPFSKAAQWAAPKKGINDSRGTTVGGMLSLVETFLPSAVLMENVAGFLSGSNNAAPLIDRAFNRINALNRTNYRLHAWVVNAADYGVPQHRKRAIVIALRDGLRLPTLLPTTHAGQHRTAWDALGQTAPATSPAPAGKYADLLPCIPEGNNYQYLTARGAGEDFELFGYRTKFWSFLLKLAKDAPSWTLPASPGPSTGPFHWDNRPLAASERMLLQGFPADWKLVGPERADTRLAGNATPPALAEAMGRVISHVLSDSTDAPTASDIQPTLATPRRATSPPPPMPPAPLPKRWQEHVGARQAHPGPGEGPSGFKSNKNLASL